MFLLVLRPDHQDFQGTAVTVEVARKLNVPKMLLVVNKVLPEMDFAALKEQVEALESAATLVKPGGRIAYVTCSVLAEENTDQVRDFLARHPGFAPVPPAEVAGALGERAFLFGRAVVITGEGLLMTPRRTDTDGFFVSVLRRS